MAKEATADQKLVRELQKRLTESGHGRHVADGIYGPATREAVKRLLREIGWTDPDGELTPEVLTALDGVLALGLATPDRPLDLAGGLNEAFADGPVDVFAPALYLMPAPSAVG